MKRFALIIITAFLMISCICLVACKHEHKYDQKSTKSIYRKTIATCLTGAEYYKSCSCGKKGEETFVGGLPLGHNYVNRECTRCHAVTTTSQGLIYKSIDHDSCYVYSVGTCQDTDIVIPAVYENKIVIGIDNEVFYNNDSLETITIPNSVLSIGKNAFFGCSNLNSVIFAEESLLKTIDASAFEGCSKLTTITLPSQVESINRSAFANCTKLEQINIPNSVTKIEMEAFSHCFNLRNITLPNALTDIGDGAFEYCDFESIILPSSLKSIGTGVFVNCNRLTTIHLIDNQNYKVVDNNLYSYDGKMLLQYAIGKTDTSFVVPDGVVSICDNAFSHTKNLVSITLPETLTEIGEDAFIECNNLFEIYNLSKININKGSNSNGRIGFRLRDIYTSIDSKSKLNIDNGFIIYKIDQENLLLGYIGEESVLTIPNNVSKIENSAFEHNINVKSIIISDALTTIGEYAFAYCSNLTSISMGKGLIEMEIGAFLGCSKLENIIYSGTATEWKNIIKDSSWDFSTVKYKVHCSDGILDKYD